jgi:hypothetical protein
MSRANSKLLALAVAALCACMGADVQAAKKKEKTIADLATRPVVVQPDQKVEASSQRAMVPTLSSATARSCASCWVFSASAPLL